MCRALSREGTLVVSPGTGAATVRSLSGVGRSGAGTAASAGPSGEATDSVVSVADMDSVVSVEVTDSVDSGAGSRPEASEELGPTGLRSKRWGSCLVCRWHRRQSAWCW